MMAAYNAAKTNPKNKILLIEKNKELGKKLLLTGGGRCNITNNKPIKEQIKIYPEKTFIKHALYKLNNKKLLNIFQKEGIRFKTEDNGKIFPKNDKSQTITNTLKKLLEKEKIETQLQTTVQEITKEKTHFTIKTNKKTIKTEKIILSTGGITYPQTGSTGDGYKISKKLKHTITPIKPGLVSLKINDNNLNKLSGTPLNNVKITYKINKKIKKEEYGNILITHQGLSGPAILDISNQIMNNQEYDILNKEKKFKPTKITLDLQKQNTIEELKEKIENDIKNHGKKEIKNYLKQYMSNKFIEYFLSRVNINKNIKLNQIRKKDKNKIINNLKNLEFKIDDILIDDAKITIGGINKNEINEKTLESKIVENLYFSGEILEPAGPSGGYNLQLAFSTGYLAGYSASI